MKLMVVNKWFFPIFGVVTMALFYLYDNASISPVGLILTMILAFIGLGVTERLDKIIYQNNIIVNNVDELEERDRISKLAGK